MDRHRLTPNFFLDEFARSDTAARHGIDIHIDVGGPVYANLLALCTEVLQPLREALGPVHVLSGYRPPAVNRLVGGALNSAHLTGRAADIVVTGYTPLQVCEWIEANIAGFDQVIHEFGQWTHVAIPEPGKHPRKQALTAIKAKRDHAGPPATVYVPGLVEAVLKEFA